MAREGFEIVTGNRQHSSRVVRSAQKATASHDHSKQAHHEATSSNSHPKAVTHKPKSHQSQHKKESAEIKDVKTKPKMNRPVKPGKNSFLWSVFSFARLTLYFFFIYIQAKGISLEFLVTIKRKVRALPPILKRNIPKRRNRSSLKIVIDI